jgi:hypothetical protein
VKQPGRDPVLDVLLDLDGQVLVVDPAGRHWVRFVVHRVAKSPGCPHGLSYSLSLHDAEGGRLVGFDNAHPVRESRGPGGKAERACDHKHRLGTVRPYRFTSAAALLEDFWREVDGVLKEKGAL